MKDELRLLNALIGMANSAGGWPSPLKTFGFRLTAMQKDVGILVGGERRFVTPEAVFQSIDEDGCLVIESKSATLDDLQARKYWELAASDLVAFGACAEPVNVSAHEVAPIYFCSAMHSLTLKGAIDHFNDSRGAELPLVDYDNHRFMLQCGSIRLKSIHVLFEQGLYFPENEWPTRFVPFDFESPDEELVGPVMQELVSVLLNPDVEVFSALDLARGHPSTNSDGCVPFYDTLGSAARKRYRVRIAAIVEQFRVSYLARDLSREKPGPAWKQERAVDNARYMSALLERATDFTDRVKEGRALPRQKQVERLVGQEQLEELVADSESPQ